MKMLILGIGLASLVGTSYVVTANAEETVSEKAQATGKSVKRSAKKGLHRTKEALCGKLTGDSKAECLAKEAGNRIEETADSVKDKAVEIKNDVDSK